MLIENRQTLRDLLNFNFFSGFYALDEEKSLNCVHRQSIGLRDDALLQKANSSNSEKKNFSNFKVLYLLIKKNIIYVLRSFLEKKMSKKRRFQIFTAGRSP